MYTNIYILYMYKMSSVEQSSAHMNYYYFVSCVFILNVVYAGCCCWKYLLMFTCNNRSVFTVNYSSRCLHVAGQKTLGYTDV